MIVRLLLLLHLSPSWRVVPVNPVQQPAHICILIGDNLPFGLYCAATEGMVLESVIEKLLAILE